MKKNNCFTSIRFQVEEWEIGLNNLCIVHINDDKLQPNTNVTIPAG